MQVAQLVMGKLDSNDLQGCAQRSADGCADDSPHTSSAMLAAGAMDTAEGVAKGCKTVDLDSLSFAQGGHLMSSKTCTLPKKSYRITQKVRLIPAHTAACRGCRSVGVPACWLLRWICTQTTDACIGSGWVTGLQQIAMMKGPADMAPFGVCTTNFRQHCQHA